MKRMQYCDWCGEELGVYDNFGEPDCCGKAECCRELRRALNAEKEERAWRAEQDDFEKYR